MRNYGLPATYYTKDPMGTQQGFEKFLAADVSATELEDRIMTAQNRVINSNPEVTRHLNHSILILLTVISWLTPLTHNRDYLISSAR
jgi:hypothetical protein